LCRRDVLELRVPFGALDLVAVILGGNQFPGADQLVFGRSTLGFTRRTGRSDRRERQDCSHSPTWIRRHRFVLQKGFRTGDDRIEKTANTQLQREFTVSFPGARLPIPLTGASRLGSVAQPRVCVGGTGALHHDPNRVRT